MDKETREVELPADLVVRVEDRVDESDFESVDDYVTYVIEGVVQLVEQEAKNDEQVEDGIQSRLKSLGYLDE